MQPTHHKYIIIGSGISGLQAASILAEHNQDFVILQANNRIGGRICTLTIGDALAQDQIEVPFQWLNEEIKKLPIECGATWLSEAQPTMHQMVKDFQLTLFEQSYTGANVLALNPKEYLHFPDLGNYYNQYKPKIIKLLNTLEEIEKSIKTLQGKRKDKTISKEESQELDELFNKYDSINAYDFILQQVQDQFLAKLLANQAATLECSKCEQYSVLTLMASGAFANVEFYIGVRGQNIDGFRMKEGVSTLIHCLKQRIQATLDKLGKKVKIDQLIKLNTPVTQVRNHLSPVQVLTSTGEIFTCETVLAALPSATFSRIKFTSISPGKQLILDNQIPSQMGRQAMVFKTPFWRPQNSGYVSFSHQFAMNELVDLTPSHNQCGILGFVFTADGLQKWKEQIRQQCKGLHGDELRKKEYEVNKVKSMKIIADLFLNGNVEHQHLKEVAIFTRCLADNPYIRATYQSTTSINTYKKVNALGENYNEAKCSDQKNVIVLGSDFADDFNGYMEGAVLIANHKVRKLFESEKHL